MQKFIYRGEPCQLGRFGPIETGQRLELEELEAEAVQHDERFLPNVAFPSGILHGTYTAVSDLTLPRTTTDLRVICQHAAPTTVKLPADPAPGQAIEVVYGPESSRAPVTIDGNGKTIEGSGETFVLTDEAKRVGLYWDGTIWKTW